MENQFSFLVLGPEGCIHEVENPTKAKRQLILASLLLSINAHLNKHICDWGDETSIQLKGYGESIIKVLAGILMQSGWYIDYIFDEHEEDDRVGSGHPLKSTMAGLRIVALPPEQINEIVGRIREEEAANNESTKIKGES